MGNLRELSNKYLAKTLVKAGTQYFVIDPQSKTKYPVIGTVGDISLLVDTSTGEAMQNRTVVVTCLVQSLPVQPRRGWEVQLHNLTGASQNFFIQEVQPDNTIGLYYFTLGNNFKEEAA
jgi:hypothetical protein